MKVTKCYVWITEEGIFNAARNGNLEVLKNLLDSRQEQNPVTYEHEEGGNLTVLHIAARFGYKNIITWYKDVLGFDDLNPTNDKGITPFQLAVKQQKLGIVSFYIAKGYNASSKFFV